MAFTHDLDTDEGVLRTLLGDTDSTDYIFEDAELTALLDLNGDDVWRAAADGCRSLAAKYTKEALDIGLGKGDIRIDKTKRARYYSDLAKTYDGRSGSEVSEYVDSMNIGVDAYGSDRSEYVGDD